MTPRTNEMKIETSETESSSVGNTKDTAIIKDSSEPVKDIQDIDDILNSLKALLSTVEKLQKVRQELGDIKPLIGRMLDGEIVAGEELDQLKTGVSSLSRLVRAYSDHQAALVKAQPARQLLDRVLKEGYPS
jgi:DNA repair ATPase RecN